MDRRGVRGRGCSGPGARRAPGRRGVNAHANASAIQARFVRIFMLASTHHTIPFILVTLSAFDIHFWSKAQVTEGGTN